MSEAKMNQIAESYVNLVLRVGQYDPDLVDAYFGPQEWLPRELSEAKKDSFAADAFSFVVQHLLNDLEKINIDYLDNLGKLRYKSLEAHIMAVQGRINIVAGKKMIFDEETSILYNVVAPKYDLAEFKQFSQKLDKLLPGKGDLNQRYNEFRKDFIVPKDKIEAVFNASIQECRKRTAKYIDLPEGENFSTEYVQNKPWGAYNWYQGNMQSLIQVNTTLPFYLTSAVGLASHEGYPGHHTHSSLIESKLVNEKNWVEFTVLPLYCPNALIMEGVANYCEELLMTPNELLAFKKEVLVPLAGIEMPDFELYEQIQKIRRQLTYARIEICRQYLDGHINKDEAIYKMKDILLYSQERAEQSIAFFDQYRSYIVNYALGYDLVKAYIENHVEDKDAIEQKWALYEKIISTPQIPNNLTNR